MDLFSQHTRIFQCSVAISPPDAVIAQVQQLKQQLRSAIGWYGSVNARAHITFNVFQADADQLAIWETYTGHFAAQQSAVPLRFDLTDTFINGAFFLKPDEASEQLLVDIMQAFHQHAPLPAHQSIMPHISVGRRLTTGQLSVARKLIPDVDIHFECSDIVLRRFNEARKQYDIYRRFPFSEKRN